MRTTTARVSAALAEFGILVCPNTVARLLHSMDYSLRVNHKKLAPACQDRNQQFLNIQRLRQEFGDSGEPIVSVDTKKREMVGNFKNPGRRWGRKALEVNDHDFPSLASGIAIPYGVYDLAANRACVSVGVSHDTSAFAAASIARWWTTDGITRYPGARRLLVLADSGGSNGCSRRLWKTELQRVLADPFDLRITVAHYPTGASKWNPIEHRAFPEISKNWAGEPLVSYARILAFIGSTTTKTGLAVAAHLDRTPYQNGVEPTPQQLLDLRITYADQLPKWNYTILPKL
jgi:hypothetical protein